MSGKVVGMVFDFYPNGGSELLLAVKLADNADDEGRNIFPSVGTLARCTRQSERTVQYQLKRMQDIGWLQLVRFEGGGRSRSREYRINPLFVRAHDAKIPEADRPTWTPDSAVANAPVDKSVKGAKIAPFSKDHAAERVQSGVVKGATAVAGKGAIAVAPEPSITSEEHKTPLPPANAGGEKGMGFDAFWSAYPKKSAEGRARRAWARLKPDSALQAVILAAVAAQMRGPDWQRKFSEPGQLQFLPMASTWLHGERWLDDVGDVVLPDWWHTTDGVKAMGLRLGSPYSLQSLGNAYTDDERLKHWRDYRAQVLALAGDGPWSARKAA